MSANPVNDNDAGDDEPQKKPRLYYDDPEWPWAKKMPPEWEVAPICRREIIEDILKCYASSSGGERERDRFLKAAAARMNIDREILAEFEDEQKREKAEAKDREIADELKTLPEIVRLARIRDGLEFNEVRKETIAALKAQGKPVDTKSVNADVKRIRQYLGLFQKRNKNDARAMASAASDRSVNFPPQHERPCYRMYEEPQGHHPAGLYYHTTKDGAMVNVRLCSPLRVLAETRSRNDSDYGLLIEFLNENGWKKWGVPQELLVGEASEMKRELMRNGLKINPDGEKHLVKYFRDFVSEEKLWSTSTTGWDGISSFVLPERVLGEGNVYFQSRSIVAPYGTGGTFEGWRKMAALAVGNPLLMLGISASFAGPLLKPLHITGAALHLYGDSSLGKSTIQRAAVATWGGPKFKKSWNSTTNGLEGYAAMHTDTMLALDEIGEVHDMKIVAEAAYAFVNGSGRGRMQTNGEMRATKDWCVFLLSSGERTIESVLAKERIELMAGQQVRVLDIQATGGKHGAFGELHGRATGAAFSFDVSRLAAEHYGWGGIAFVEMLLVDGVDGVAARHAELVKEFKAAEGQESRAARVFAICALAGEMAIEFGIVDWTAGAAKAAAMSAFRDWKERTRSSSAALTNQEDVQILTRLIDGIEQFEDTRFSDIRYGDRQVEEVKGKDGATLLDADDKPVLKTVSHRVNSERFGYWEMYREDVDAEGFEAFDAAAQRRYYLTSSGLKKIMRGFDHSRVIAALDKAGAFFDRDKKQAAKVKHVPGKGPVRMYWIDIAKARDALDSE